MSIQGEAPFTAVIIPFYQKERGILGRALDSVFLQEGRRNFEVIVVDDGSPVSAAGELVNRPEWQRARIRIVRQRNAGPGAARNRGLESVLPETRLVAFLDSDDEWFPHHLADAEHALNETADVYFADFYQLGQEISAFERAARIQPNAHPLIQGTEHLHLYQDDMVGQIITGNVIGTSTVVYEYARYRPLRFRTDFRNAGEDYLFWLALATSGATFAFSSRCDARYGKGINIYTGSNWGSEALLHRIHDEIKYRKEILRSIDVKAEHRTHLCLKLEESRAAFVRALLHQLVRLNSVPAQLVLRHFFTDPRTVRQILPTLIGLVKHRR